MVYHSLLQTREICLKASEQQKGQSKKFLEGHLGHSVQDGWESGVSLGAEFLGKRTLYNSKPKELEAK